MAERLKPAEIRRLPGLTALPDPERRRGSVALPQGDSTPWRRLSDHRGVRGRTRTTSGVTWWTCRSTYDGTGCPVDPTRTGPWVEM